MHEYIEILLEELAGMDEIDVRPPQEPPSATEISVGTAGAELQRLYRFRSLLYRARRRAEQGLLLAMAKGDTPDELEVAANRRVLHAAEVRYDAVNSLFLGSVCHEFPMIPVGTVIAIRPGWQVTYAPHETKGEVFAAVRMQPSLFGLFRHWIRSFLGSFF